MPVTATTRLPAGWYPDPDGGGRRRWWDGREWTQYTADFQRPSSVDDLDLEPAEPAKSGKLSRLKPVRRLRRVEEVAVEQPDATPRRATAERLGRWLASAVHARPRFRKGVRRRGAHRSGR